MGFLNALDAVSKQSWGSWRGNLRSDKHTHPHELVCRVKQTDNIRASRLCRMWTHTDASLLNVALSGVLYWGETVGQTAWTFDPSPLSLCECLRSESYPHDEVRASGSNRTLTQTHTLISKSMEEANPVVIFTFSKEKCRNRWWQTDDARRGWNVKYLFVLTDEQRVLYISTSESERTWVCWSASWEVDRIQILCVWCERWTRNTLRDCLTHLDVVLWHQSNLPSGVLCFNPTASNILSETQHTTC